MIFSSVCFEFKAFLQISHGFVLFGSTYCGGEPFRWGRYGESHIIVIPTLVSQSLTYSLDQLLTKLQVDNGRGTLETYDQTDPGKIVTKARTMP